MEFIPFLFKGHGDQPKEILKAVEDFEHRNFSFEVEEFIERYMLKHALYKLIIDEKKIDKEEFTKRMREIIRKMILENDMYVVNEIFLTTLLELGKLDLFKELWNYDKVVLKRYLNDEEIEDVIDVIDELHEYRSSHGDYDRYKNAAVVSNDAEIMDYVAKKVAGVLYFDKETAIKQAIKEKNFDLIPFIESIEQEEE